MVQQVSAAWGEYFQGRSVTARKSLVALLATPQAQDPVVRLGVLENLLDICIQSHAEACVWEYAQAHMQTAQGLANADEGRRLEYALRAAYYFDQGRLALHDPKVTPQILDGPQWKADASAFPRLALQRQVLAANVQLELNNLAAARQEADKLLAMTAALGNPQEDRVTVAWALTEAIRILNTVGESDRAYGAYQASRPGLLHSLPGRSPDALAFRMMEGGLLQEQGDLKGASQAVDDAIRLLDTTEFDADLRDGALASALTYKAALCALRQETDCARAALARHPLANLYARPGRRPASYEEVTYLTALALTEALAQGNAAPAAMALSAPLGFKPSNDIALEVEAYRAFGAALGQPPGQARAEGLFQAGQKLVAKVRGTPTAGFGAWRRPNTIDRLLISLALTQADSDRPGADETTFALMQMAARYGSTFDADAQTVLAQAANDEERRILHGALRMKARRDQLERRAFESLSAQLDRQAMGGDLSFDPMLEQMLRAASSELARLDQALAGRQFATAGANLMDLKRFQAALRPDEAALAAIPAPGGFAYACIRQDGVQRRVLARDLRQYLLDQRIVQSALTAGHAPSDEIDAQFPVTAATRLYDLLIRPFDGCLKPDDDILWISGVDGVVVPLAVLLETAPPKLGEGYDLAAAGWLMRRHRISYPGSASLVVAARAAARSPTSRDFLGVGDPLLAKPKSGPDVSVLAALPETRDELKASAKGFKAAKLLMGAAASEGAVRKEPLADYRFLSFATHGLVRGEIEGVDEPALVLTAATDGQEHDDGLLTASEIADLNLAARFVALSACNTANVDLSVMSGELAALSSAFAMAGAPSVLGTLWPVESETGKRVVSAVFQGLAADPKADAAQALAEAQRAFLGAPPARAYAHPRFWAPFVVLGDGGTPLP